MMLDVFFVKEENIISNISDSYIELKSNLSEISMLILLLLGICATIFFNPSIFHVTALSHDYSLTALLIPIMALGTIIYLFENRYSLKPNGIDFVIGMFMFYLLARELMGFEYNGALKFVIFGICFYCLTAITMKKQSVFQSLILGIVLITMLCVIYGLFEYAAQDNFLFRTQANLHPIQTYHRIYSSMENPVIFGAVLVQVLPFSLLLFAVSHNFWIRLIAIITFMWTIAALMLSFSKGSWIAASIVSCFVAIYFVWRKGIALKPALVAILMCVIIFVIFWPQISTDVSVRTEDSVSVRYAAWNASIEGIADNYLGGVGFNRSVLELRNYLDNKWMRTQYNATAVDNSYLSIFMEEGVAGILLWLVMLGTIIALGIKTSLKNTYCGVWALSALASVVGFAINSFTFDSYQYLPNIMFFWISAGIIRGTYQLSNRSEISAPQQV